MLPTMAGAANRCVIPEYKFDIEIDEMRYTGSIDAIYPFSENTGKERIPQGI